jgi:hypothetical protein
MEGETMKLRVRAEEESLRPLDERPEIVALREVVERCRAELQEATAAHALLASRVRPADRASHAVTVTVSLTDRRVAEIELPAARVRVLRAEIAVEEADTALRTQRAARWAQTLPTLRERLREAVAVRERLFDRVEEADRRVRGIYELAARVNPDQRDIPDAGWPEFFSEPGRDSLRAFRRAALATAGWL